MPKFIHWLLAQLAFITLHAIVQELLGDEKKWPSILKWSLCVFSMGPTSRSWDYLGSFISSRKEQGNKSDVCFIKNKISILNKSLLFLKKKNNNPPSCLATKRVSAATAFLKVFKSKPGKSCSHYPVISMNHQFAFHDFLRIPSIFCSLFCSMFLAAALPSPRV